MRLIIGIGNTGAKYENTRHNAGFLVADALKGLKSADLQAYKSTNFMNDSGVFVKKMASKFKIPNSDLYIVHDDLDIPLGKFKIQFGRGPKDHNGILDIEEKLETKDFWRVRVGIDNRPQDNKPAGEVYTLENFTPDERKILDGVIKEVCKKLVM